MTARHKKSKRKTKPEPVAFNGIPTEASLRIDYLRACKLAEQNRSEEAQSLYGHLAKATTDLALRALIENDLAALAACSGDLALARIGFQSALAFDGVCATALANLAMLDEDLASVQADEVSSHAPVAPTGPPPGATRVALVSFLFNWPSTGGGNVHTYELAQFLGRAGYEVKHFYVRFPPWEIGNVPTPLPYPSQALVFDEDGWTAVGIQNRFRAAVDAFGPDHVIITDSWNIKPLLAEALNHYPYILRFQALECLCPLNNVRLLFEEDTGFRQCPLHQFANPNECGACVHERGHQSGSLHQAERALSGVGSQKYYDCLLSAVRGAEAALVVNPLMEAMLSPYTKHVRVATAGMDPARFPWPWPADGEERSSGKAGLLFAGLVEESIKGFGVLHKACALLWRRRQDFELVATGDPPGQVDEFTRFVGWQTQEELPRYLRASAMLVMPTIAQEALGRTAVEAMAAGRPVVASRLGGLSFTVADGATGLLCEPGDPEDLARKIERLLDDPALREQMGQAGRRRFEEHYAWPVIIERHYRPILGEPVRSSRKASTHSRGR